METRGRGPIWDTDPGICLEDLRKTTETPNSGQSCLGRNLRPVLPDLQTEMLITRSPLTICGVRFGNASVWHSRGTWFESRPGNRVSCNFLKRLYCTSRRILRAGHWRPTIQTFLMHILYAFRVNAFGIVVYKFNWTDLGTVRVNRTRFQP